MKYKNTKKARLLEKVDLNRIRFIWTLFGLREAAYHFKTTQGVIRSIVNEQG